MKNELKTEAIRLRVAHRLSLNEISKQVPVSKSTLSLWLRQRPLTKSELHSRAVAAATSQKRTKKEEPATDTSMAEIVSKARLSSGQKAKVAEAAVLLRLLARGFNVFGSVFDGDRTDWIVEVPTTKSVLKLQVKMAKRTDHGLPTVSLQRACSSKEGARRYEYGDFDFIVGYDLQKDAAYVWSWADVENRTSAITISEEALENWIKLYGV